MEAEQNQEVPEAVAETQEVAVQQEEKPEPKSEEVAQAPSEAAGPEKTPETEHSAGKLPEKEKATESEAPPVKLPESKVAKSPEETPAAESLEKPPQPEKQEQSEEPQVQVSSEPEKQEEEAVKEVESKPTAVNEAKPEESDKVEETKTEGVQQPEAETQQKEPELPFFFGWFLFPEEEERIKCATMDFLKTLDTLDAFKEHISEFTGEAEKEKEVDLEQYFQNSLPLHCTTKFCDYGKAMGAKDYAELQVVKESFGKSDELSVTALIVTPRTFGARVALTETQIKLWPEGADKEGVSPALLPSVESLPAGSRAHVTLGCSAGVESVQTGLDLLEILALQKEGKEGTQVEMELGTLSYLSEGRWYLALREPITADTTFSSFSEDKPTNDQGKKDGEKKKKKCTIL